MDCISNSVSNSIASALEKRIVAQVYLPGARLDENSLANEFGVSRTPVREALGKLNAWGLIDIRPRRGAVVSETPPHKILEMFEVMAGLEAMCAKLAARRCDGVDRREIIAAQKKCELAACSENYDRYELENARFHRAIYAACRNQFLQEQTDALARRLSTYRMLQLRVRGRIKKSIEAHAQVVDALMNGDGDRAAESIYQHVQLREELFIDWLASLSEMGARGHKAGLA